MTKTKCLIKVNKTLNDKVNITLMASISFLTCCVILQETEKNYSRSTVF